MSAIERMATPSADEEARIPGGNAPSFHPELR